MEQRIEPLRHLRDENGCALIIWSEKQHYKRTVSIGADSFKIQAPRVDARRPQYRFASKIPPPHMRRAPCLEEAVPALLPAGSTEWWLLGSAMSAPSRCANRALWQVPGRSPRLHSCFSCLWWYW
jgi:hypothetical protein